jgi:hypothetical protein
MIEKSGDKILTTNNITEPLGTGWGLWFGWVGVNFFAIIGSLLIFSCWFIILLFMGLIGSESPNIAQSNNFSILAYIMFGLGFIICAITGAIIGALQKFILRNHFILERKWIIASTIGGELVLIFTLITYFLPYFCANTGGFYSITQTEGISNR